MKRLLLGLLIATLVSLLSLVLLAPMQVERLVNGVEQKAPYPASSSARQLHQRLIVADLHADTLLWSRDLLERARYGHVDVPRLIQGNVALQVFAVATKAPWGLNYDRNPSDSDMFTLLTALQRWPRATWTSLTQRALYQAQKLRDAAVRSQGTLVLIESASDLDAFLARHRREPQIVGGLLAIEGLHALEGELSRLDSLYEAGFRIMAPTHFFDNALGGSAHGMKQQGLTEFGRRVIRRMQELRITVDLAHAAPALIDDVLDMATRPVLVSHTGVKGTCEGSRNISDEHVRRIAATGGVIGIGFWDGAVCEIEPDSIVRAIRHVVKLAGVDHVGLGSDFDGGTHTPFDTTGLVQLTEALLADGFSQDEIRKIMGANVIRVLSKGLP